MGMRTEKKISAHRLSQLTFAAKLRSEGARALAKVLRAEVEDGHKLFAVAMESM